MDMEVNILGPSISYVDLLDHETYQASIKEEESVEETGGSYNPLRPSSAGKCTRELAYGLMEYTKQKYYPKDIRDPNVTRLLNIGHFVEDHLIGHFRKYIPQHFRVRYPQQSVYGFTVESVDKPELNHLVEGSLDWCFWSKEHRGLIDAKSKKDKFHRYFKTDWDATDDKLSNMESVEPIGNSTQGYWIENIDDFIVELNDPFFEANFWQLNFYANTDWAKKVGIDHASIIQYNKNDSRIREIRFKPSVKLYERTNTKFQSAFDAATKGRPQDAKRDFMFGSIKCAFCSYNKDCWSKGKDAKGEYFKTHFPKKKWPLDTEKVDKDIGEEIESLYDDYKESESAKKTGKKSEGAILKLMLDLGCSKIRFKDGRVYESKLLKSPHPHYVLRRTKL